MELLALIRSLGFGALLGSGIAGFIYSQFPTRFAISLDLNQIMGIGACLGAGSHGLIHKVWNLVTFPISNHLGFYGKVVQVLYLKKKGVISQDQANQLLNKNVEKFFT